MSRTAARRPAMVSAILSGLARTRSAAGPASEGSESKPYETEDVKVVNTWAVVAGLAVTVALVIAGLAWMQRHFEAVQRAALPPVTRQQAARLDPPAPNLQADAYADAARHQADQEALLSGYAYTDAAKTRARIPIERAMTLTVGKPLDP